MNYENNRRNNRRIRKESNRLVASIGDTIRISYSLPIEQTHHPRLINPPKETAPALHSVANAVHAPPSRLDWIFFSFLPLNERCHHKKQTTIEFVLFNCDVKYTWENVWSTPIDQINECNFKPDRSHALWGVIIVFFKTPLY